MSDPLSPDLLRTMHAYRRAAGYLSVGQIYLQDNPLLETPLALEHIAVLGGVDLTVFTGGIGENDPDVRTAIYGGLSWVGVRLDDARNQSAGNPISDAASRCAVQVLASNEDEQIARHTRQLVAGREIPGHRMATK